MKSKFKRETRAPKGDHLNITLEEWQDMHPFKNEYFVTDKYYHQLAQKVMDVLVDYEFHQIYSAGYARVIALGLTAYFEDVVSDLGLFRAFVQQYRKTFDNDFPFYPIEEEYLDDEVNLVDVRFLLWFIMAAFSVEFIPNPENPEAEEIARKIYQLFLDEFEKAPINNKLVQMVYDKNNLNDLEKLKTIFRWMSTSCYLLPIMTNSQIILDRNLDILHQAFPPSQTGPEMAQYIDEVCTAFFQRRGPLALYPNQWYALMRQAKGITQGNDEILKMKASPVYPFVVVKEDKSTYTLRSPSGREYEVDKKQLLRMSQDRRKIGDIIVTLLLYYKGVWKTSGFASMLPCSDMNEALETLEQFSEEMVNPFGQKIDLAGKLDEDMPDNPVLGPSFDKEKCDKLIAENKGNRIWYFKNLSHADDWVKKNILRPEDEEVKHRVKSGPVAIYINDKYQLLLAQEAQSIHDPSNKYYSKKHDEDLLSLVGNPDLADDQLIEYLLERGYLDRLRLNSILGEESALKLMQNNLRFFLTLVRQYPF